MPYLFITPPQRSEWIWKSVSLRVFLPNQLMRKYFCLASYFKTGIPYQRCQRVLVSAFKEFHILSKTTLNWTRNHFTVLAATAYGARFQLDCGGTKIVSWSNWSLDKCTLHNVYWIEFQYYNRIFIIQSQLERVEVASHYLNHYFPTKNVSRIPFCNGIPYLSCYNNKYL